MSAVVELAGVSKTYGGAVPVHALRDVSFTIGAGELVSIIGPSGSGKSTLLGLLGCLDLPTDGLIRISGVETTRLNDAARSRLRQETLGFIFQQFHLIPFLSARRNVETALLFRGMKGRDRRDIAGWALGRVGLSHRADHRPNQLSGGEQQRVAIARALASEPAILLADEPTGNLDTENATAILGLLESISADGTTVVLVTHDLSIAGRTKRQLHMRDGQLREEAVVAGAR
ncbi:MAG: ABC transporter ATP-binding protein [bacterium]